jgi:hypothetical protein
VSSGASWLSNLSTRAQVLTGDAVMIGGLIVDGTGTKQVLVRARGPSLADAGVSGVLQDPVLEIYDEQQNLIAMNDNWQSGDVHP